MNIYAIHDLVSVELSWLTILLAMMGKFCVSSSNVVMPVYTAELFPTVMRNLGMGSSNVPAGVALMLVPYLWNLVSTNYYNASYVSGSNSTAVRPSKFIIKISIILSSPFPVTNCTVIVINTPYKQV